MPLIVGENLRRVFGEGDATTVAVDNISINIDSGEFLSIMGASGSGKSTLLHILGLLDKPTSGKYLLKDQDTTALNEDERAQLRNKSFGFVFQSFHLMARTSVIENVMLPLSYSQIPASEHRARATAALESVELSHRLDHTQGQLSGGEKQRVAIARALVADPEIIFADEPTGNLDSKTGHVVMQLLAELHSQGKTIIVITHEEETADYAKRKIILKDGRVHDISH